MKTIYILAAVGLAVYLLLKNKPGSSGTLRPSVPTVDYGAYGASDVGVS